MVRNRKPEAIAATPIWVDTETTKLLTRTSHHQYVRTLLVWYNLNVLNSSKTAGVKRMICEDIISQLLSSCDSL